MKITALVFACKLPKVILLLKMTWKASQEREKGYPPQSFTEGSFSHVRAQSISRVRLSVTPWAAARQAPLSVGFSRREHWSGLPSPAPGALPDPEIRPASPHQVADSRPLSRLQTQSHSGPNASDRLPAIISHILHPLPIWFSQIEELLLCFFLPI